MDCAEGDCEEVKDYTRVDNKENKHTKRLRNSTLFSWLLAIGLWGYLYFDFYNSCNDKVNIKAGRNRYSQVCETKGILTGNIFTAGKFEKEAWVSFYQRKFLKTQGYYCTDENGKDPNVPDGLADRVEINGKEFIRVRDYENNKEIFHKADEYIAATKKRLEAEFLEKIG